MPSDPTPLEQAAMPTLQDARAREQEARDTVQAVIDFAYAHGYHEHGVPILPVYAAAIETRVRCELAEGVRSLEFSVPLGGDTPMLRRSAVLRLLGETER